MPANAVTFDLDTRQADGVFAELFKNTSDLSPLMELVAGVLMSASNRAFDTESSPEGVPWADLAESTQKHNVNRGGVRGPRGAHPMLRVTDALFDSREPRFGPAFAEIVSVLPDAYPSFQQTGTGRMPARPYIGMNQGDVDDIVTLALRYLLDSI